MWVKDLPNIEVSVSIEAVNTIEPFLLCGIRDQLNITDCDVGCAKATLGSILVHIIADDLSITSSHFRYTTK